MAQRMAIMSLAGAYICLTMTEDGKCMFYGFKLQGLMEYGTAFSFIFCVMCTTIFYQAFSHQREFGTGISSTAHTWGKASLCHILDAFISV